MRTTFLTLSLFLAASTTYAAALKCPEQHPAANNKLIGVALYDEKNKTQYDLAPSSDTHKGKMAYQTWDGFTSEADVKTYVRCNYLNTEETVTLEIPNTVKSCHFSFPYPDTKTSTLKANFECE